MLELCPNFCSQSNSWHPFTQLHGKESISTTFEQENYSNQTKAIFSNTRNANLFEKSRDIVMVTTINSVNSF